MNSSSLSLIIICFSLLSLFHHTQSTKLLHDSCKKAAKDDNHFSYNFCVASIEADPKSQKASNPQQLLAISIKLAIANFTSSNSKVEKLMEDTTRFDRFGRSCLSVCRELFFGAIDSLKRVLPACKSRDYGRANLDVSAALDASVTCEDGFKEKEGEVSPLSKENNNLLQLTAIALNFLEMCY